MTAPRGTAWFVPGRIEVLGKHTDYAGGRSLLAAVDRGLTVRATARSDRRLLVRSDADSAPVVIELDAARAAAPGAEPEGHWSGYVRSVAQRLEANFPGALPGADVEIASDLPLAAGMSSSSALVTGLALALMDLGGIRALPAFTAEVPDQERLAEYLGCIENGQSFGALAGAKGVGTFGGSEDHTAMLCGQDGSLVQYAFCPVRREAVVPFPPDRALVVAVSGVAAEKTGAARDRYNAVSIAAREIVQAWNAAAGRSDTTLGEALASAPAAEQELRALAADLGPRAEARLSQFLTESEVLVPAAADALTRGDLAAFGDLVDRSQRAAEEGLGNQVPETIALQRLARELGADAASAFGAGFGGSIWAMVPASGADDFAQRWLRAYLTSFPDQTDRASTLVTRPGPPAHRVEAEPA